MFFESGSMWKMGKGVSCLLLSTGTEGCEPVVEFHRVWRGGETQCAMGAGCHPLMNLHDLGRRVGSHG